MPRTQAHIQCISYNRLLVAT